MPAPPAVIGPSRAAVVSWCAALLTLPWVGVDLIILVSGRDAGAGLQPSWVLLAVAWLAGGRPRPWPGLPRSWQAAAWLGAAAVAASGAGLLLARAPVGLPEAFARYAKQCVQLAVMIAFALWPVVHLRGAAWRSTARWLVGGALLQAGYGALQQVAAGGPLPLLDALERVFTSNPSILSGSTMLYVGDRFIDVPRLRGTACEPLYLGNYLLLAIPMVLLTGWGRRARALCFTVLGALLLLTWSRGAWIGAGAAAVAAAWWCRRPGAAPGGVAGPGRERSRFSGRAWLLAGTGVAALLTMALAWEPAGLPLRRLAQTFSSHDWSNLTRLYSLQAAWRAWLLSPVVGIGWGQFGWHFPALVDPAGLQAMFTWPVVANLPLLVLCETGLVGLAALLAGGSALARAVAGARRGAGGERLRVGVLAVACAGLAVQYLTFAQYNLPHAWVGLGLLAAALLERRAEAGT